MFKQSYFRKQFFLFKTKLLNKCIHKNIELRQVDRFFPSSKLCSCCGNIKKDLMLSDRIYKCNNCNISIDRDLNAYINLRDSKKYKIINNKIPVACREFTTVEC